MAGPTTFLSHPARLRSANYPMAVSNNMGTSTNLLGLTCGGSHDIGYKGAHHFLGLRLLPRVGQSCCSAFLPQTDRSALPNRPGLARSGAGLAERAYPG